MMTARYIMLLFVVFEPWLNTSRITIVWMKRLRVHLFPIIPPRRQPHSDFRGRERYELPDNLHRLRWLQTRPLRDGNVILNSVKGMLRTLSFRIQRLLFALAHLLMHIRYEIRGRMERLWVIEVTVLVKTRKRAPHHTHIHTRTLPPHPSPRHTHTYTHIHINIDPSTQT